MKRLINEHLKHWLISKSRKPLILIGARQVGKTWSVRQFAKEANRDLIELNFERDSSFVDFFIDNEPKKILQRISSYFGKDIDIQQSVLFLDEIQMAPQLLSKLRWFAEEMPDLPVITAGSLLDFVLKEHSFSMPVGRVNYAYMEPLSFEEFLIAVKHPKLCDFLKEYQLTDVIVEPIHHQLMELLREYFFIGGMPGAVKSWSENHSINEINIIHQDLLKSYRDDFAKYAKNISHQFLEDILTSVPKQLGEKFQYVRANPDAQSNSLKKALIQLFLARVCHKVQDSDASGLPLEAGINERIFKVILLDIGLVSALLNLSLHEKTLDEELHLANEGGLAEQFVGQTLRTTVPYYIEPKLFYWVREKKTSSAEVDFLIQYQNTIVPIEVKAGTTGTLRSLHLLMGLKQLPVAVRINADKPSVTNVNMKSSLEQQVSYRLISLPLYLTGQIQRLLNNCRF